MRLDSTRRCPLLPQGLLMVPLGSSSRRLGGRAMRFEPHFKHDGSECGVGAPCVWDAWAVVRVCAWGAIRT
jgi:hypothetical protein